MTNPRDAPSKETSNQVQDTQKATVGIGEVMFVYLLETQSCHCHTAHNCERSRGAMAQGQM